MKKTHAFTLWSLALFSGLFLIATNGHAQEKYFFERLSVSDGLSNSVATTTYQDHLGFLWISTVDGLNRFDGYDVKKYKSELNESGSLPNNLVTSIYEDSNNDLWIGSVDQVFRYNRQDESFTSFNISKGPNSNSTTITQILEDSNKRLWIATARLGMQLLDRRTGTITGINHVDYTGNTIPFYSGVIFQSIIELRNGDVLGISPLNGVYVYNESSNKFEPYFQNQDLNMKDAGWVYEDEAGKLWFSGRDVIYIYKPAGEQMRRVDMSQQIPEADPANLYSYFQPGADGKIYLVSWIGLIETDSDGSYFSLISEELGNLSATHLYKDRYGIFWISTEGKGVFKLDPSKKPFRFIPISPENSSDRGVNSVDHIILDQIAPDELLFTVNNQGIYRYNGENSYTKVLDVDAENLLSSEDGRLWYTDNQAISYADVRLNDTKSYPFKNLTKTRNPGILNLKIGPDGKIWVMGYRGIETFDYQNETFGRLPSKMNKQMSASLQSTVNNIAMSDKKIASIVKVGEGEYLTKNFTLSEPQKVLLLTVGEGRLQTLQTSMFDFGSIIDSRGNTLWSSDSTVNTFHNGGGFKNRIAAGALDLPAGTYTISYETDIGHSYGAFNVDSPPDSNWYGIQVFRISEQEFSYLNTQIKKEINDSSYPPFEVVFDVEFSNKYSETAWIASGGTGLIRLNLTDYSYKHYSFDDRDFYITSFNQTQDVLEDKNGIIWLITRGGLIRFDPEAESYDLIDQEYGLSSNQIQFMIEDLNGNIWFGTPGGISMLDKSNNGDTISFINYDNRDGINSLPLNSSVAMTENGEIFYGGIGGLNSFFPGSSNTTLPEPVLSNLTVSGKSLKSIADEIGLESNISEADEITLPYTYNNLSFDFASIHFSRPEKNKVAYMLEGVDSDWNYSNRRFASYLNLSSGDYVFKIKGSNGDGIWNPNEKTLNISILPPWWSSWWAYVIYGGIFITGIIAIDRIQRRRVLRKEKERAREKELQQAKKIEEAYHELEKSHQNLKAVQEQLIQQEKLASLGQLTAGIAHEIKNPLNFVNNFSDLSIELVEETEEELKAFRSELKKDIESEHIDEAQLILTNVKSNLRKIHEHGTRADSIVKSMLQHSRGGSGKMEPTKLNALIKEYVTLSFHGMRAAQNPINVDLIFDLDESIDEVNLIVEDFSRVIINLCSNAFDAMREKLTSDSLPVSAYQPKLIARTKAEEDSIRIEIEDNGPGIPKEMNDKIMQPFFTTKKGTEGTGLGLSITNDIVRAHGGTIEVESRPGEFTLLKLSLKKG